MKGDPTLSELAESQSRDEEVPQAPRYVAHLVSPLCLTNDRGWISSVFTVEGKGGVGRIEEVAKLYRI